MKLRDRWSELPKWEKGAWRWVVLGFSGGVLAKPVALVAASWSESDQSARAIWLLFCSQWALLLVGRRLPRRTLLVEIAVAIALVLPLMGLVGLGLHLYLEQQRISAALFGANGSGLGVELLRLDTQLLLPASIMIPLTLFVPFFLGALWWRSSRAQGMEIDSAGPQPGSGLDRSD